MKPCNVSSRLDDTDGVSTPMIMPDANMIELPIRAEDVVDLFKRFQHERKNLPPGAWRGPTPPKLKVFEELSFSELFGLNALWHRVKCPHPPNGTDAMPGMPGAKRGSGKIFTTTGRSPACVSAGRSGMGWSKLAGTSRTGAYSASTQQGRD